MVYEADDGHRLLAGPFDMTILFVIFLTLMTMVAILLICYHSHQYRQRQQQLQQQQQLGIVTADAFGGFGTLAAVQGADAAMQANVLPSSHKYPTPPVIINNLPVIKYHPLGAGSSQICAICYDEFQPEEDVKLLPCMHSYHGACIDAWLRRGHTCPICNYDVIRAAGMSNMAATVATTSPSPPPGTSVPRTTSITDTIDLNPRRHNQVSAIQQQQQVEVVVVPPEREADAPQRGTCHADQQQQQHCHGHCRHHHQQNGEQQQAAAVSAAGLAACMLSRPPVAARADEAAPHRVAV
jgi:hypothetical protein